MQSNPDALPNPQPLHTAWVRHSDRQAYAKGVERIRELIAMGDLFQANLTSCTSTTLPESINNLELFRRLRRACPAPLRVSSLPAGMPLAKHSYPHRRSASWK